MACHVSLSAPLWITLLERVENTNVLPLSEEFRRPESMRPNTREYG